MEINIKLSNEQVLCGFRRTPEKEMKASVIMVHGLGEHIGRYAFLSDLLIREGIGLTGVDLPGHGRSPGRRGYIKNYSLLIEMIDILLRENLIRFPDIPAFVYGHSLGGGIVLNYLLKREPAELKGAIISSPWLKLGSDPSVLKKKMVSLMKGIIPGITLSNGLNPAHLSNDSSVVKAYIDDPLVHDRISLSLADCAFKAAANAIKEASDLKIPVLIMHGSDDKICSPDGSKEFVSRTRMAELKIWKGGFHELHNDINKYEVINYVINWINQKI